MYSSSFLSLTSRSADTERSAAAAAAAPAPAAPAAPAAAGPAAAAPAASTVAAGLAAAGPAASTVAAAGPAASTVSGAEAAAATAAAADPAAAAAAHAPRNSRASLLPGLQRGLGGIRKSLAFIIPKKQDLSAGAAAAAAAADNAAAADAAADAAAADAADAATEVSLHSIQGDYTPAELSIAASQSSSYLEPAAAAAAAAGGSFESVYKAAPSAVEKNRSSSKSSSSSNNNNNHSSHSNRSNRSNNSNHNSSSSSTAQGSIISLHHEDAEAAATAAGEKAAAAAVAAAAAAAALPEVNPMTRLLAHILVEGQTGPAAAVAAAAAAAAVHRPAAAAAAAASEQRKKGIVIDESWESMLPKDVAQDAAEILLKYSDRDFANFRPRPPPAAELEEDLERGVYSSVSSIDPSQCRVYGPGLQEVIAGVLEQFYIQTVTTEGLLSIVGGAHFTVYIQAIDEAEGESYLSSSLNLNASSLKQLQEEESKEEELNKQIQKKYFAQAQVLDNEDGVYTVIFSCSSAGLHKVEIFLDGKHPVASSPYIISVSPGRIDASQTFAKGDGLKFFEPDGKINEFVIQARDAHANDIKKGGDKLSVEGLGAIRIVETLDCSNGRYSVKYFVAAGCEMQYCRLNVKYDGRHIKGSPFFPQPLKKTETQRETRASPSVFSSVNILNPSASLLSALITFKKLFSSSSLPLLPVYHPFPSHAVRNSILNKLPKDLQLANVDLAEHQLAEMRKELKKSLQAIVYKEEVIQNMLECIKQHLPAGLLCAKIEEKNKNELNELIQSVAEIQQQLHTTYKSLQHHVANSLPVEFELEDPKIIREEQKRRREKIIKHHSLLQEKAKELQGRELRLKDEILKYLSVLSSELKQRQQALEMQNNALFINTQQVLKQTNNRLKRHSRREALIACQREAVEAKKSFYWQKDFQRMLVETPVAFDPPPAAAAAAGRAAAAATATGRDSISAASMKKSSDSTKHLEIYPTDDNSFAYWIANKQYSVSHRQNTVSLANSEGLLVDERTAIRRTNLRRGNPSRVSFCEWRAGDTSA